MIQNIITKSLKQYTALSSGHTTKHRHITVTLLVNKLVSFALAFKWRVRKLGLTSSNMKISRGQSAWQAIVGA